MRWQWEGCLRGFILPVSKGQDVKPGYHLRPRRTSGDSCSNRSILALNLGKESKTGWVAPTLSLIHVKGSLWVCDILVLFLCLPQPLFLHGDQLLIAPSGTYIQTYAPCLGWVLSWNQKKSRRKGDQGEKLKRQGKLPERAEGQGYKNKKTRISHISKESLCSWIRKFMGHPPVLTCLKFRARMLRQSMDRPSGVDDWQDFPSWPFETGKIKPLSNLPLPPHQLCSFLTLDSFLLISS